MRFSWAASCPSFRPRAQLLIRTAPARSFRYRPIIAGLSGIIPSNVPKGGAFETSGRVGERSKSRVERLVRAAGALISRGAAGIAALLQVFAFIRLRHFSARPRFG